MKNQAWFLMLLCVSSALLWGCTPPNSDQDDDSVEEDMGVVTPRPDMLDPPDLGPMLPPGQDVSIATFNVERLFDEICDTSCSRAGDFETRAEPLVLNSRIERIHKALVRIDADVIVLQEFEKESLLDRLMEDPLLAAQYPTRVFGETGFGASLDVAVISKGALVKSTTHRGTPIMNQSGGSEQFARELLELHLDIKGVSVVVFGAHFISKASNNSESRRWAEANAAGMFASEVAAAMPGSLVVLAGDLNDTLDSAPLQALSTQGMVSTAQGADPSLFYTHVFGGQQQIIDHIFYVPMPRVVPLPDGLSVLRDEGGSGLASSDHASPRQVFRVGE